MLPIVVQFFSKFAVKHAVLEVIEPQKESADVLFSNIKYVLEANELRLSQVVSIGSDNGNINVGNNHSVFSLFHELMPRLIKGRKNKNFSKINSPIFYRFRQLLFTYSSQFSKTWK